MTPWQILRAGRVSQAALGHCVHHGPGVSVRYSTATAAFAAPDSSKSFCLSNEKLTLQQLNRRLALYLQQVQCLKVTNQRLEHQIQEALRRKCPREIKELDRHLRTASVLQDQISECLLAQADLKLQLLSAELTIFNLSVRCEKECERREHLETELSNLRSLEEELKVHKLPKLQSLLNAQTQQLMELQIQHQQDMQGLLAQVSVGIGSEMQTVESSDLIQQLDDLRRTSMMLLDKNQNECWFNTQVPMLSSPESFDSSGGTKVAQAEVEELRRTAASLVEELTQLQALNDLLEAPSLQQTESFMLQLVALQQRADSLCRELDSVLQATAQHAADRQILLDIKSQLETEIQDYRRLLDEQNQKGYNMSPAACRIQAPLDRSLSVQGGNLRIVKVQRGHMCTVGQTPVVTPQVPTVQLSVTAQLSQNKDPKNSSELMDSFRTSVKQGTGALSKRTGGESMIIVDAMINRQSSPVEDKVHIEDCDQLKSFIVSKDKEAVVQDSKMVINAAQGITTSVHDELCAKITAVQAKPESLTSKETTKEIGLKADRTERNIQIEISNVKLGAKAELKQGPHYVTHMATTDPSKQAVSPAMLKKERETVIVAQTDNSKGSVQAKNEDLSQITSYKLKTPSETVRDSGEVAFKPHKASGSHSWRFTRAQIVSDELTTVNDKDIVQAVERDGTSLVLRLDQNSALFDASKIKQNKVMEDEDTITSLSSSNSNGNLESKTASTEILKKNKDKVVNGFHETKEVKVAPTLHYLINLEGQEALLSATESKKSTSLTDSGVALSSSDPEDLLSPRETDVFLSPTKTAVCMSSEICPGPFETEKLMSLTDQVFSPVDLDEDHFRSPDFLLSPNDSEKCLSPVEMKGFLSPDVEEEEEVCLSEAKAHVRPVEKYIITTKEEGQSLSFSSEQTLPEGDGNRRVTISVRNGDSLCFGSFENNEARSSSLGDLGFRGPGCSIVADKKEPLDFDALYWKSVRDARTPRDSYNNRSSIADNKDVQSPGGRYDSEDQKETASTLSGVARSSGVAASNSGVALATNFSVTIANPSSTVISNVESSVTAGVHGRFRHGSGEWMVYGSSLGHKSSLDSGTSLTSKGTKEGPLMATHPATNPTETGRFGRRGNGEWMFYRSSRERKSSLDGSVSLPREGSGQSLLMAANPVTANPPEVRGSGKRESGEWMVYGGSLQRKHSVESGLSLPRTGSEESTAMDMLPATSQQGAGRFDSRESGEWMPVVTHHVTSPPETRRYGNRRNSKWMVCSNSDSLPNTGSEQCLPVITNLATSPPRTGRFGSGEWRVYGGPTGRMSSMAGSSLTNAESEESPSAGRQLATSPPVVPGAGRFGSGGSGEWRVYGGSTGRMSSSAKGADRVKVRTNEGQMISPPNSFTCRGPRLSEKLSSGVVVRRSRSVGSSGRLSSSGSGGKLSSSPSSHRISSSGKLASTGSRDRKPICSSASGCRSSVGSARPSNGERTTSIQTDPSPRGRASVSGNSGVWLSSSTNGGIQISSSGSRDRISSQASGGFSSSSGSGRTSSRGGQVINSSDRLIRSTSSGTSGNKERISVCKMAALSISAAGRERSQERRRPTQQPNNNKLQLLLSSSTG